MFWERVRRELEGWFTLYPTSHSADLRARFRSPDPRQHLAAWWELYLFRLFQQLGFDVEVHPHIAGAPTHPDFRLVRDGDALYVEALTVFSGIVEEGRHGAREAWVLDLVNEAKNPNFFVGIDFERVGTTTPARREVVRPIEEWLATLDPDAVSADALPELRLRFRDWDLTLDAFPVKPDARGKDDHRVLGRGPLSAGWVNDVERLQVGFARKFRRYGDLPDPLVVAVLGTSSFLELRDVEQSLFGREAFEYEMGGGTGSRLIRQRNGVWMGPTGPRATSVTAVLSASGVQPWTVARELPNLWLNPWAKRPLSVSLPFASATANNRGLVEYYERSTSAAEVFGLAPDWPGPDEPFPR